MRHAEPCQYVHWPVYQPDVSPGALIDPAFSGGGVGSSMCDERKASNGAVKTAATSFASRRGISTSSTFGAPSNSPLLLLLGADARACVVMLRVMRPVAAARAAVRLMAAMVDWAA